MPSHSEHTGVQRAGRRRIPDGYGLGTRTDGPERLRRPSRPLSSGAERMHVNADRVMSAITL
jgi:hypothetical protein